MSQTPQDEQTRSVVIESLGVYLPRREVTMREVIAGCRVPPRFPLEEMTGIRAHRQAAEDEFSIDMAREALRDCLARSRYSPSDIDLLICAPISHYESTQRHAALEPVASLRLKAEFGCDRALAFDLSNGCAGIWTGMLIAHSCITTGLFDRVAVASGEFLTGVIATAQREIDGYMDPQIASLTVGDAGAAVLLEGTERADVGLEALSLHTVGKHARLCIVEPTPGRHGGARMLTNSLRMGATAIEHASEHLASTLRYAGWPAADLSLLIPHQTSESTLRDGLRRINERLAPEQIPPERYLINLARRANTGTTTHFVALRDAVDEGRLHAGDRAAFSITGSGLSVGTALYTFDDLPERLRQPPRPGSTTATSAIVRRASRLETPRVGITAIGTVAEPGDAPGDSVELCRRAGAKCLEASGLAPGDVELAIFSGSYRTNFLLEPAISALIARSLELNADVLPGGSPRTLVFDLRAGHLGTLKACWAAEQMIRADRYSRALVLASDVENSRGTDDQASLDLQPAASALLLERGQTGAGFELFHFRAYPEYLADLETWGENPDGNPRLRVRRTSRYLPAAARCLATTTRDLLDSVDLRLDAFDAILSPGLPGLDAHLASELGVTPEHLIAPPARGDLMSSSLAFGIEHLRDTGAVDGGSRVLILSAGSGLQTGCAIVRFS